MDELLFTEHNEVGEAAEHSEHVEKVGNLLSSHSFETIFLLVAGVFYLVCAAVLWRTFRNEKNELVGALFAFLVYQAIAMFLIELDLQTGNIIYGVMASLAVFIGSAYMLKFPMSSFSETTRKILFRIILIAVFIIFAWFLQNPEKQQQMIQFAYIYDIIVNGLVVGGSMIIFGFMSSDKIFKLKAIGGGSGIISCCIVANAAMIGGFAITGSFFEFIAPVLILGSLVLAKKRTNKLTT